MVHSADKQNSIIDFMKIADLKKGLTSMVKPYIKSAYQIKSLNRVLLDYVALSKGILIKVFEFYWDINLTKTF
jgi:hypothetical protein